MKPRDGKTATIAFVPPVRVLPSTVATSDIAIAAPPNPPDEVRNPVLSWLVPVVMAVAMAGVGVVSYRSGSPATRNPALAVFPAMMLMSACVTAVSGRARGRTAAVDDSRDDYLDYLCDLRESVAKTATEQRLALLSTHPDPAALWILVGGDRMWERRCDDPDFFQVRVGVGVQSLATRLVAPSQRSASRSEPVTDAAIRRFITAHSVISAAPIVIALPKDGTVGVDGEPEQVRGLLRAMLCQLAVWHAPDRLLIAAIVGWRCRDDWEWLKWLPHHQHPSETDDIGPARMTYPNPDSAEAALAGMWAEKTPRHERPRMIIVVDDSDGLRQRCLGEVGIAGATVLLVGGGCAAEPPNADIRLQVRAATVTIDPDKAGGDADGSRARADRLDATDALTCARRLARFRATGSAGMGWQRLMGIEEPQQFDPATRWHTGDRRDRLRVPIGVKNDGNTVEIDIKEAAENGMGPHGLCVGATGSGKSELLRTVALGMMTRHSPEELNLALVDFKGGATFVGLQRARHVAAVITNLADEASLVARMREALSGEMTRRQQLLRSAGNFVSVAAYDEARRHGTPLSALPSLFIIVDEFSELLSCHPEFHDTFVAIGRLGRSLGMHLLLSSQRLDEGRLRGLDAHLSYRISLKTLSAGESRTVLGVPDAYELPNTPGAGYLQSASGELTRFQTAFVSGPCPRPQRNPMACADVGPRVVHRFTAARCDTADGPGDAASSNEQTLLQVMLDRLCGQGPLAHRVWLPPLEAAPTLESLLEDGGGAGALSVPVGMVDRPFEQRRTPMLADLSSTAGHVAVVGAPQSGKSNALCTLITALAATHTPEAVQFYCLDFGGGALESVRQLPHVGSVANRGEPDLVEATIAELEALIRRREAQFRTRGIGSMAHYRRLRRERDRQCAQDRFGDVFLVVDGWAGLRQAFDALEASITALAGRGLALGVHVAVSATRWGELRPALKDQIGTRLELRLGDPADSEMDRRGAHHVPVRTPGRGLTPDGLHMMIAIPLLDGVGDCSEPVRAGRRTGELLRRRHGGREAPPVRLLPDRVDGSELVDAAGEQTRLRILLGLSECEFQPVAIDFDEQPHLLVFGDDACGKSSTLRTLCREIVRTATAEQAQMVIVDYRRALLGVVDSEYLGGYAMSAAAVTALLPGLLARLNERMPGPHVSQQQLRSRSWWSGPEIYLLVDDYDLVATAAGNPLAPISDLVPHARDLGLHVVVARRTGGAARALFEPLLAGLRDLGATALMMSGNPDDGPLLSTARPTPLPPGRGTLIGRATDQRRIQVAWSPPP